MTERLDRSAIAVEAIHDVQQAEHGGPAGVRDAGMHASAPARPKNIAACAWPDVCRKQRFADWIRAHVEPHVER